MATKLDIAKRLAGSSASRSPGTRVGAFSPPTTARFATVTAYDSTTNTATVLIDGSDPDDGDSVVTLHTDSPVAVGDRASVVRGAGGFGKLVSLAETQRRLVTAKAVADEAQEVADAINQHFFTDTSGVHVTTDEGDAEGERNILINSLGILLRQASSILASLTSGSIAFYDGAGNAASNILLIAGASGVTVGRANQAHVAVDANGMSLYGSDGSLAVRMNVTYASDAQGTVLPGLTFTDGTNTCAASLYPATSAGVFSGGYRLAIESVTAQSLLDSEGDLEVSGTATVNELYAYGASTFVDEATHDGAGVTMKSDNLTVGDTTNANGNAPALFRDSEGAIIAKLNPRTRSDGAVSFEVFAQRVVSGTTYYNGLDLQVMDDGSPKVVLHHPAAWRSAMGAQQTGLVTYVDSNTNITNGTVIAAGGNAYVSVSVPSDYTPMSVVSLSTTAAETRMTYTVVRHNATTVYVRVYNGTGASVTCSGAGVRVYCVRNSDL